MVSDLAPAIPLVREAVAQGREVLFAGTPCQAAAIRAAFGREPLLRIVEVVCHGTPLPEVFDAYKGQLEKQYGAKLVSWNFRDKRLGWSRHSTAAVFENGSEYTAPFDQDPYMQIDTVIYFSVTDPKLFTYGVVHPMAAIENLTATTLRNIIGDLELDQTLTSRDIINTKMRTILDEATDPWGIKINRVELKNIIPPREIQDAMAGVCSGPAIT